MVEDEKRGKYLTPRILSFINSQIVKDNKIENLGKSMIDHSQAGCTFIYVSWLVSFW